MLISTKFYEEKFKAEKSKDAYLKACKWIAKNIVSKVEVGETTFSIKKVEEADLPTFVVELYCSLEESTLNKTFCNKCVEFHNSWIYFDQDKLCNGCKMKAYSETLKQKLITKKSYRKQRLNYALDE